MKDYKGALYFLMTETHEYNGGKIIPIAQKAIDDLQELVNRSEPEEVIVDGHDMVFCPNCGAVLYVSSFASKFCYRCGQALEWENEKKRKIDKR